MISESRCSVCTKFKQVLGAVDNFGVALLVGVAGGYAGSKAGSYLGQEAGVLIYENRHWIR